MRALTTSLPLQVAIAIVSVWTISLGIVVRVQLEALNPMWAICLVGWQTWSYTGLFIAADDAMHGSIHTSSQLKRSIVIGVGCWI